MFGHKSSCPLDIMVGIIPERPGKFCPSLYVNWLESAMNNAFEFAHQNLGIAAQSQSHYYDKGLKPREFHSGDWVWRISNELGQGWTGPYLVLRKISGVTYEIQFNSENKPITIIMWIILNLSKGDNLLLIGLQNLTVFLRRKP